MAAEVGVATNSTVSGHTNHWTTTATKSGTYEFKTGGKYVDRNIDLVVPQAVETVSATASVDVSETITELTLGEKILDDESQSGYYYKFTASKTIAKPITGTATASVGTKGFTDDTSYTGSTSGTTEGTFDVDAALEAAEVSISGSATVVPNTASKNTNSNVSTGTIVKTKPNSGYYLGVDSTTSGTNIAFSSNINVPGFIQDDDAEVIKTGSVTGGTTTTYIPITGSSTGTSASGTKVSTIIPSASAQNVNVTEGYTPARYWQVGAVTLDIAKNITGNGSIGVSASDPGAAYTANTDAVIPSDSTNGPGYLTLSAGYYPATKISLSTLVPDDANIGDTKGVATILTGTTVYDKSGNLLTGTMTNNGATGGTISTQNGTYTIPAGYTTGGTVTASLPEMTLPTAANTTAGSETSKATVGRSTSTQYIHIPVGYNATAAKYTISATPNAATPSLTITDNTNNLITPSAISGDTTKYNITTAVTGKTTYGTAGYIATSGLAAATDSSAVVGQITAGSTSGDNSGVIPAGGTFTVNAGYYPSKIEVTAADSGAAIERQAITGSLSVDGITSGYTSPSLKPESTGLSAYVTISGNGSMTSGNVYNGTANKDTKYMEVYTGQYSIA